MGAPGSPTDRGTQMMEFRYRQILRRSAVATTTAMALGIAACGASAQPNKPVYDKAQQYTGDVLKLLERLVNIDSGTGDEQGVNAVGAVATEELKRLGARIETFSAKSAAGDNIVASFTGTGRGKVFLIAHMDTVFAKGTVASRSFTSKDGRAYGPGVTDNKGGIVVALFALKMLQDINFKNYA